MINSAQERVTSISDHRDLDKMDVYKALLRSFTEGKDHDYGNWTDDELLRAEELVLQKYDTEKWLFLR
jgi:lipoate-protein ligase A